MFIAAVGMNHRTAPVNIREKFAFSSKMLPVILRRLRNKSGIDGCVILNTCNRTEIYTSSRSEVTGINAAKSLMNEHSSLPLKVLENYLYTLNTHDCPYHLFQVAAGLDSMILGEDQILAQVSGAYQTARDAATTNGVLNTLWQQAITVGKRVRTETKIDSNTLSISYAAVEMARNIFHGDLKGRTVLIIGAGQMSRLAARYLKDKGVTAFMVSNRSYERAVSLAREFNGRALRLDHIQNYLSTADIVISCTAASHLILFAEQIAAAQVKRRGKPLLLIDIAVPRDIDPAVADIPGVSLFDIDDLEQVVLKNFEERKNAVLRAESIIKEEVDNFYRWLGSLYVIPTITALKKKADVIREAEFSKACRRLGDLTPRERKIIGSMVNSIINQILHEPIINLKESALTSRGHVYSEALKHLFNLDTKEDELQTQYEAGSKEGGRQ